MTEKDRQLKHQARLERHERAAEAKHLQKLARIEAHKNKIAEAIKQKQQKIGTSPDLFKKTFKPKTLTPCYICHAPTEGKFCSDECVKKYFKKG
jgi:hypothetical protein